MYACKYGNYQYHPTPHPPTSFLPLCLAWFVPLVCPIFCPFFWFPRWPACRCPACFCCGVCFSLSLVGWWGRGWLDGRAVIVAVEVCRVSLTPRSGHFYFQLCCAGLFWPWICVWSNNCANEYARLTQQATEYTYLNLKHNVISYTLCQCGDI